MAHPQPSPPPLPRDAPERSGFFLTAQCANCHKTETLTVDQVSKRAGLGLVSCRCGGAMPIADAWAIADGAPLPPRTWSPR